MKYDLIVIGGGSGGVRAARIAADLGAKVAIIEDTHWGGTCVNVGCVPKKIYHYAASIRNAVKLGKAYGWDVSANQIDWQTFHAQKTNEIARLEGIYTKLLSNAGCDVIQGHGKLIDAHTVSVTSRSEADNIEQTNNSEQRLTAERILIAVGGQPIIPNIEGAEYAINSDKLFELTTLPKRLVVIGGGYIACEMASIFHHLGSQVTLIVRSELLKAFDREAVAFLENELVNDGLTIIKQASPKKISKITNTSKQNIDDVSTENTTLKVELDTGKQGVTTLEVDQVLFATGRKPRFANLGLETTQVSLTERGFIDVNDNFQTKEPSIYAVGDIIEGKELTPVALEQGMFLAKTLYDKTPPVRPAFDDIATAIFTHPQMASVGLTEQQAVALVKQSNEKVAVYTSSFRHIKYSITDIQKRTFMKLLVNQTTDAILGIHMVGDETGEIMQGFSVLLHAGITKTQLDQTIGIHPTVAEELVTMREPTRVFG